MKIISLQAENIKKLTAVEITPQGALVQITGANGSGKSSVLDSIYWALAGAKEIASQPVRKGAQKAAIKLDLGEVVVTRRFTEGGGTTLTVEAANGARFPSPQKMLDDLLGALTFDPLAFSRMEPKKQLEQLRGMVQLDIDIDALDAANTADFTKRTEVNRTVKQLEAQAASITVPEGLPDLLVDVSALLAQMEQANAHNAEIERRKERRAQVARQIEENNRQAMEATAESDRLLALAAEWTRKAQDLNTATQELIDKLANAEPLPEVVNPAVFREQIERAQAVNESITARDQRVTLLGEITKAQAEAAALTSAMDQRTQLRQDAIAAAAMPVPGLSFGAGEVLYNGLPFDQASSAEQLRVSVAIAMAMNPKLRVLRIKDGSLLDDNGLQMINDMATAGDYQVWVERVDTSGKVGIVMEDGHVKAVESAA